MIDWFHAPSYPGKIAADAFGEGMPTASAWFDQHKALLHDDHRAASIVEFSARRHNGRFP